MNSLSDWLINNPSAPFTNDITITILKDGSQIKIGIDAPIELGIERFNRDDEWDDKTP